MSTITPLDPLRFPLQGSRLVEASAGTGKTFTIAALYVRLILGHGGPAGFARALVPPEILVVSFTEAATQELRERIRARLAEAAAVFRAGPDAPADALLLALRADYVEADWPRCARKLELAAEWMDEAAVSTIHGWCKRMLAEHAFDSGALFEQTLETDQSTLFEEVARDYWRCFYAGLPRKQAQVIRAEFGTPAALLTRVRPLLPALGALSPSPGTPAEIIAAATAATERVLAEHKPRWSALADELEGWLAQAVADKQVDGRKIQARFYLPWLDALRSWASSDARSPDLKTGWERLTPGGMREAWKGDGEPAHAALDALVALRAALDGLPEPRADLLCHAAHEFARRIAAQQLRRASMGFDELLTQLDAALQGRNGARLGERIRSRFPVALIDEFQDTDPVQYRIFDAIYRVADEDASRALVLIGDPKQAIYSFRGADIYTYLRARRATAGRHYTLARNFRSTQAMVAAVNAVFARAEASECGAFRFGHDTAALPFTPVQAQGRTERFVCSAEGLPDVAALNFWLPDAEAAPSLPKEQVLALVSDTLAAFIVQLLRAGQGGKAGFAAGDGVLRAVLPGDIAILVNNGSEARALRTGLRALGVRSVYLSDNESVFASPQAIEVRHWLTACAEPTDARALRAALATASLGLDWRALEALSHDEEAWDTQLERFRGYHAMWQQQGVLPMLRRIIDDFGVARRLLHADDERGLTDLLHLAELLQQASTTLDGEHALLRHLVDTLDNQASGESRGDVARQRLESDAALLKVVTVHKSKGLEYPLVFLPFATHARPVAATDSPIRWHAADGSLKVTLRADQTALALADEERLAEDVRKLYVALTRARHACWVGLPLLKNSESSAAASLLGSFSAESLRAAFADEIARGEISLSGLPQCAPARFAPASTHAPHQAPSLPLPAPRERWWIASYSSLRIALDEDEAVLDDGAPGIDALRSAPAATASADQFAEAAADGALDPEASGLEPTWTPATPDETPATAVGSLHGFPRGAAPGSFLHGLLEWFARKGFRADAPSLRETVARRCAARGWGMWTDALCEWLRSFAATSFRLPGASTPLQLESLRTFQAELEFWFALDDTRTDALDAIVRRHVLPGMPRPRLEASSLRGLLKGFIDLVFEHEGRYYVADYKSNSLGRADAHYSLEAMQAAILAHRYDLQYSLYLFALHRQLAARLPGYDSATHLGGAAYFFLRGHASASQGLHFECPPGALIDALEALFGARS